MQLTLTPAARAMLSKVKIEVNWRRVLVEGTAVSILILLPFAIFWALWSPNPADRVIFTGDVLVGAFPTRVYIHRLFMAGEMPLWNPYQLGGMPLLADIQAAVYYPPNLLLSAIYWGRDISYTGFEALIVVHYAIGAVLMYGYLRHLKLHPAAALLGAIAFEFNGFFIGHRGHYSMLSVVVWVPGVMWFLDKAWSAIKGRTAVGWTVAAGLILSQLFMGGHPQLAFYSGLFIGAYFLYRWVPALQEWSRWIQASWSIRWKHPLVQYPLRFGVAGVLGTAVSAIALLPMFELLGRSLRSDLSYAFSVQYPLMPRNLISLFIPEFLNWSGTEFRIYGGVLTLVLALVVWFVPKQSRPERWFFTISIPIAIVMAMGGFTALHGFLYRFIPGFSSVRVTARLFYFANISFSVLAAMGAHALFNKMDGDERQSLTGIVHGSRGLLAGLGLIAITFYMLLTWYSMPVGDGFYTYESLFVRAAAEDRFLFLTQTSNQFLLFVVLLGLSLILLWVRGQERTRPEVIMVAAVILMAIDISTFAPQHDAARVPDFDSIALVGFDVRQLEWWQAEERDAIIELAAALPEGSRVSNPEELLPDNYSQTWEIPFSTGYNVLDLAERFELLTQWPELSPQVSNDLMNVSYIVTSPETTVPPEDGATILLENSQGKVWQRATVPEYAHFSNQIRPSATSITINGLLTLPTETPFTQPALAAEDAELAELLAASWPEVVDSELYQIGTTGQMSPVDIGVLAGGSSSYSAIMINGETVTPEQRGMIVAAVDPETSELLFSGGFDTYASEAESNSLASVINNVPNGTIVALATYDEGTGSLTDQAREAIGTLGAAETLQDAFGLSYALVGVKGAEPGTAVERLANEPLAVDVGMGAAVAEPAEFSSHLISYGQDQITLLVENSSSGLLTVSETVYPGWKAFVNGVETPILRSNGMFRSVVLPAGSNEVSLVYDPFSVRVGAAVSLLAVFVAVGILLALTLPFKRRTI